MSQQPQKNARSLYHRWRSSTFSEVVAQEHVTRTLRNAVARGKIVHAYLFCGPRGTGKTSTARILAKAVNCLDPRDGEPCNRCASCVAMNEGRAIDLIEIDAASNRGIDDARELRDKIKFSPGESRYKVYIIDEAHMLTSEASNALLKTLEEPPDHAILILATTESHKILPTILSRCQHFDFRRIPLRAIVDQLQMICESEGLAPGEGVLDRVARMARGSLRDAESLLDQLVAYCGETIELEEAREVLGLTGEESVPDLADALLAGDLARGFMLIDGLAEMGADLRHFTRELVDYLRAIAVVKSGAVTSLSEEFRHEEIVRLKALSDEWGYRRLVAAIKTFGELDGRMKQESFGQVHLEMAFMEAALPEDQALSADAISARRVTMSPPPPPQSTMGASPGSAPPAVVEIERRQGVAPVERPTLETASGGAEVTAAVPSLDLATVRSLWRRAVTEIGASGAKAVAMALEGGHPMKVADNVVVVGVDENRLWRKTLETPGAAAKVATVLGSIFGTKVAVRFEYGARISREALPSQRDAVVEAAVHELGFNIARVDPATDTRKGGD